MTAKKGHIAEKSISEVTRQGIQRINNGEKKIYLHSRKFNDDDAAAIAEALKGNTSLAVLNLFYNEIGDAGASAIAEAMKVNKTLRELSLWENHIGDAGASAFGEAMKVNKTLQTLGLSNNQITDIGVIAIAKALVGNSSLKELDLCKGHGQVTEKSVPALKEMLQSSNITSMGDYPFHNTLVPDSKREELEELLYTPIAKRTIRTRTVEPEKKKKKYSIFIARHPLDDGISHHVAINIKNALSSSEVFVDGGRYQHLDIPQLLNEMDQSQTVVLLLLNNDTLKMPVCLIELNHAIVNGISIVIVIDENEMNVEDIIQFVNEMETGRGMNEAGMELMKWCGVDIDDVGMNVRKMVMDAARNNTIKRINTNSRNIQEETAKMIYGGRFSG